MMNETTEDKTNDAVSGQNEPVVIPKVCNKYHNTARQGAVYIGRGSPFGNPFVIGKDGNRDLVCGKYETMLLQNTELLNLVKTELKGKDLVCFCAPKRCHGDTLLRIANEV